MSLGAASFLAAKLGPKSPEAVKNIRRFICRKLCREREILPDGTKGVQLARLVDGIHRCGRPWDGARNMYREGCGCDTDDKSQYDEAACPRGLWGPGGIFHKSIQIVVAQKQQVPPKPGVST